MVKDVQNIFYNVKKKKTCLGVFRIEEIRDNDNKTSLKERGVIRIENYQCFHSL